MNGVPLRVVQELMGHKTIQMTCRYAHLAPSVEFEAVDGMAASWQAKVAKATEERNGAAAESVILEKIPDFADGFLSESTDTRTSTDDFEQALVATA